MHLVKHLELHHQFKVLREAIGANGLPTSVVESYVTVLYHLVKSKKDSLLAEIDAKTVNMQLADQKKLVGSGALVYLASLITKSQKCEIVEMVKTIVLEIALSQGDEKIVDILICNVVHRVTVEIERLLLKDKVVSSHPSLMSSVNLLSVLSDVVLSSKRAYGGSSPAKIRVTVFAKSPNDASGGSEHAYLLKMLEIGAKKHLITPFVVQTLFSALQYDSANASLCIKVLNTLRSLAGSFGFPHILEALTRNGGRHFEDVTSLFGHQEPTVVSAAVSLFYDLTNRPDARKGLTTAGATQIFLGWTGSGAIEGSKAPILHVLGLIGVGLLARQTHHAASSSSLLASLQTLPDRLDALYGILLDLVSDNGHNNIEKTASYLLNTHALPSLMQFLIQVKPSCMDSPFQSPRQRSISCIVLGRILKVPAVVQFCFSEDLVNHLALSLQCSRLDEIEHLVARMTSQDRFIHTVGSKEACKALSRLSRCPSTSVNAKLKPSITSGNVPELPQALICDVMFRLHALEDLIASIKSPSDGADFVELELELVLAAVELGGYLRPLPFGDTARAKFFKASNSVSHFAQIKYANEKLLALVELVAPAILHVLRKKNACFELVATCCTALSRLGCTNAACSLLLTQGCLQIALIHLPEILFASPTSLSEARHHQSYAQDSTVDDHGILDVPASLFTLVGKLCAVAEGRTAVMRAQVLPRLLKRLQLRHTAASKKKSLDDDCKSEIAVVIQQLAMVNAVEGNTSELFLHFHVLDLLLQLAQEQDIQAILHEKKGNPLKWRLLDHALGAIAALSQDVLVCVPKVAEMGVLRLVMPFILRGRKDEAAMRAESLQYHAVSIIRSVAAYPFGKFHGLLQSIEDTKRTVGFTGSATVAPSALLERVKKVGYNFALELENRPTSSLDRKTVGELARETLTFVHECSERPNADLQPRTRDAAMTTSDPRRSSSGRLTSTNKSPRHKQDTRNKSFPALPGPPLSHHWNESRGSTVVVEPALDNFNNRNNASALSSSPRLQLAPVRSMSSLPSHSPTRIQSPSPQKSSASQTVLKPTDGSLNSALTGVDLMLTRPPGSKPQSEEETSAKHHHSQGIRTRSSTSSEYNSSAPYAFALPKNKNKTRNNDMASCNLMLDPLFQSSVVNIGDQCNNHQRHKKPSGTKTYPGGGDGGYSEQQQSPTSFVYVQEIDRFGHCVNVKARRATSGDKYVRSLGHIAMSGTQQLHLG